MRAKPARVTEIAAETIDARLLLKVLSDFKKGDFTTRLPSEQTGLTGKIYDALNEVIEINEDVGNAPEIVNADPYGQGWLIRIKLRDPAETADLMASEEYDEYTAGQE